jgi:putative RNA 2'-phosphotransferase
MKNLVKLSKFLALALRHEPAKFGLTLDDQGFTDTDGLWNVVQTKFDGTTYDMNDLLAVVAGDQDGKKRYEIQGRRIRAMFGHNASVQVEYPPAVPPELLYHGTNAGALAAIRKEGLKSLGRQYVHLTTNLQRAEKVAQRRGEHIIMLTIRALEAHQAGYVFHHAESEHYLVKALPPALIDFP